jgi:GH15 family glucan-1,4-alpha-glucosidase
VGVRDDALPPIEDYAIIGDGRSAALVSREGSIDWLCWPRFDSPPWFARLVDAERGGSWQIRPTGPSRITRRYVPHTNVLETTFDAEGGRLVVLDLMTVASEADKTRELLPDHELVRCVTCERGEVELSVCLDPRPDFGRARVRVEDAGRLGIRWHLGTTLATLRCDVPVRLDDDGRARATFHLAAGDRASFALAYDAEAPAVLPVLGDAVIARVDRSIAWWRAWIARARFAGPDREAVLRGALTLKLLAFAPSGAIVAAPTTSLPERPGGDLNWDYRYCWLRDASFTARVLLELGYVEDAEAFCSWLLHTTRLTSPELRVFYDVYGNRPADERELPLAGYRGAVPVRVGNAAFGQHQIDTYGEVVDAVAQLLRVIGPPDRETCSLLRGFGAYVAERWRLPDSGIWEPRGPLRHRTHSRLACWLVFDRLLDLHRRGLLARVDPAPLVAHRDAIRDEIERLAYDSELGCYTSELAPSELDASVLLMSYYGFHDASSPRMRRTYARIRERLGAGRGLLYRYEQSLRDREGAFWICSFWAVDHLARGGGTLRDARRLFDDACAHASDVGLMAEEVLPATGAQLGNFPQAYTHVGLVSAALSLEARARRDRAAAPAFRPQPEGAA